MIRRSWVIYRRKSRRIVSVVYHFRKEALRDLKLLNDHYGRRYYAMRLTRTDSETGKTVSRYPDIDLKELPKQEEGYG
jgi:hypothetical protein